MTETTVSKDTRIEQQANAAMEAFDGGTPLMVNKEFNVVDLERFQEGRRNYRLKYSTKSLTAFCAYCTRETERQDLKATDVLTFVDSERSAAVTVFDLGTPHDPKHGDWKALLSLDKSPEYRALLDVADQRISQRKMCEWIEEWADSLTFGDASNNQVERSKALNALRTVTVKAKRDSESTVQNFSGTQSTMESVEASSRDAALPAFITMHAAPHAHFDEKAFVARISLITSDEPMFVIRPQRLENIQEEIGEEFVRRIQDQTNATGMRVEIGTVEY